MTKNAKEINRLLWGIYINTKSDDAYIKFAFATGEIPIHSSMLDRNTNFLMQLISKYNYFLPSLTNIKVDKKLLSSFDIENLDLEVILYQAGYLTIDRVEIDEDIGTIEYFLKIPNKEVKLSLSQYIVSRFFNDKLPAKKDLYQALKNKQLEHFKDALISIFASIPYNNFTKNDMQTHEGFYASVVYVYLQSLGLDIVGEDVTN
jgi:hypothetical protein